MKYLIILIFMSSLAFASENNSEKKLLGEEKKIDVENPVIIKKLDKEVKSDEDAKNSITKGRGEKNDIKDVNPRNHKNPTDNKIKTQNISDKDALKKDEIDPNKFMMGLGDNKNDVKKDDKKVIIPPKLTTDPFNDKKLIQNINNKMVNNPSSKNLFNDIEIKGSIGVRLAVKENENTDGTSFALQSRLNLSFEKKFTNSAFKVTLGTKGDKSRLKTDWTNISTVDNSKTPINLKEAYYLYSRDFVNTKLGRFLSSFEDDYFFSNYLSFDGFEVYGELKSTGIKYKLMTSILQESNTFTDAIDIASLTTADLRFQKNNLNLGFYYTLLAGKDLDKLFSELSDDLGLEEYSKYNHYLVGDFSYKLKLSKDEYIKFALNGSFNFSADKENLGTSISIKHENRTILTKLAFLYKEKNSVINPLALQENSFTSDIVGGSFKFMYKYDEAMSSGIEFSLGKSIIHSNENLKYLTKIVYNINF